MVSAKVFVGALAVFVCGFGFTQEGQTYEGQIVEEVPPLTDTEAAPPPSSASGEPLPRSFRELSLGMDLAGLKEKLAADDGFEFRGDPDVSFLPMRRQNVVDTEGRDFIKRALFQLTPGPQAESAGAGNQADVSGNVFIMVFMLNTEKVDHYSVFTSFVKKYGEPLLLNPKFALWEDDTTRIYIERPLTVKYIDKTLFDGILAESRALESENARIRQEFLDAF
ncbi:MAG: hypothetical protein LBD20_03690 [Spirochaetaceae bacterium]|nr:hypothetical protein [Spirochaetaceae bacterium]